MRARLGLLLLVAACGSEARQAPPREPEREPLSGARLPPLASATARALEPSGTSTDGCIVVETDEAGRTASVEGVLRSRPRDDASMPKTALVLRLDRPRCIVGLRSSSRTVPSSASPRAQVQFITELDVSTTGPDLRPFVDKRVRLSGDVLGGENDLGSAAVVLLVKDVARLESAPADP